MISRSGRFPLGDGRIFLFVRFFRGCYSGRTMSHPSRFFILLAALTLVGAGCRPVPVPTPHAFGAPATFLIGQTTTYANGLSVELKSIGDSRCKPNVQCVWAGELAPLLAIKDGGLDALREVQLGTVRSASQTIGAYTFTLTDAATDSATIVVSN